MGSWEHKTDRSKLIVVLIPLIVALFVNATAAIAALSTTSLVLPNDYLLPNYDRIPLGQTEALEGGAFVARAEESLATWYNPAGVARNQTSLINASSAVFEWTKVTVEGLGDNATATTQNSLPAFIGGVVGTPPLHTKKLRLGFSVAKPTVWAIGLENELISPLSNGTERLNYTSKGSFSETIMAMTLSYSPGGDFYYGVSLGLDFTDLKQDMVVSDQLTTTSSSQNYIRTLRVSGSATSFIAILGSQWDATERLRIGAVVKLPGISLGGKANLTFESLAASSGQTTDIYFHDPSAPFRYEKPIEANLGVAYFFDSAAIEVDAKFHGGTNQYKLYGSDQLAKVTTTSGSGAPSSSTLGFPGVNHSARIVANGAIGGHVRLSPLLDAHVGAFTIFSPVKDQTSTPFKSVGLYGATLGVSVHGDHLSGSVGAGYELGSSDEYDAAERLSGQTVSSKMRVSSFSVLSALSYKF